MFEKFSARARHVLMLARVRAGQRKAEKVEVEDLLVALLTEDQGGLPTEVGPPPARGTLPPRPQDTPHRAFLPAQTARDVLSRFGQIAAAGEPGPTPCDLPLSEDAARVLALSEELAGTFGDARVRPLHMLAAVTRTASASVRAVLDGAGISLDGVVARIREEQQAQREDSPQPASGSGISAGTPLYSLRARQAILLARIKARARGSETMQVEDLLAALIIEDQGGFSEAVAGAPAAGSEAARGAGPHRPFLAATTANDLVARIEAMCGRSQPLAAGTDVSMSEQVKRTLAVADLLRGALGQGSIDPLHLLAAVVGLDQGSGAQLFRKSGITREKIFELAREEGETR